MCVLIESKENVLLRESQWIAVQSYLALFLSPTAITTYNLVEIFRAFLSVMLGPPYRIAFITGWVSYAFPSALYFVHLIKPKTRWPSADLP